MAVFRVLAAGAVGAFGLEIVKCLAERGAGVIATYRTPRERAEAELKALGAAPEQLDLFDKAKTSALLQQVDAAIFTPILTVSGATAKLLRPDQRALFFSSNNVSIDPGAEVYARLLEAETQVRRSAEGALIIRPTMIYGYPGDANLSRLMKLTKRSPVIPMPGRGAALQQPVYYKDLARIAVEQLLSNESGSETLAVAGPEPMTQRALYEAVAAAAGVKRMILPTAASFFAPALESLEALGVKLPLKAAQLSRANRDKLPAGDHVILGETPVSEGLTALAAALDAMRPGA